jgi:hypothetical protein
MKKYILFAFIGFGIGYLTAPSAPAQAFPGEVCISSSYCGRCEVCVSDSGFGPGHCVKLAGCY